MKKNLFTIQNVKTGRLNALVKNIMKQTGVDDPNEAIRLVNSGEWTLSGPPQFFTEKDGVIYFFVTSDGTSGEEWITRLKRRHRYISSDVKEILHSKEFKPTSGITYRVAVLRSELFSDGKYKFKKILREAKKRKFSMPSAEIACLIEEKLDQIAMIKNHLHWIVTMHNTKRFFNHVALLTISLTPSGQSFGINNSLVEWNMPGGFAFVHSQVSVED